MEAVLDSPQTEALGLLAAGVDAVLSADLSPADAADARRLIGGLEVQARRLGSAQVDLLSRIDRAGLHRVDGHASAKVMVRHTAKLSNPEAARRARAARALRDLPLVAEAFRAGRIGAAQVDRIALAHANPRVADAVVANEASFVAQAETQPYATFDRMVAEWVRLMDEDGTCDRAERDHHNRDFKGVQDFNGAWSFAGGCGSLQGAEVDSIFRAFLRAETEADWVAARAEHGDAATAADLARTDGQRRFDAFLAMSRRAADAHAATGGSQIVTDIVVDQETFGRTVAAMAGAEVPDIGPVFSVFPTRSYRCSTLNGNPIDPTEAVAQALNGHIRRVVVGADSVVIDLGRKQRLFTGSAALAVKLSATHCYWPGCHVPVTDCQSDHLRPWSNASDRGGGCTNPGDGAPACGRHNRFKEHGFTVRRDHTGTCHVHRPDGTEIE
ncbi:MAG: DUF222 domain-containing protein [Iamia sp.]